MVGIADPNVRATCRGRIPHVESPRESTSGLCRNNVETTHPPRVRQRIGAMGGTVHVVGTPLQLSAEVRFRRDGDRLCVDHAPQVMWFAEHVLAQTRANPDVGLSFDGTCVTLRAANGLWVWKLTGRSWSCDSGSIYGPLVMLEGIWPD